MEFLHKTVYRVSQLREYTKILRELIDSGASGEDISSTIEQQMSEVYRIVGICLGIPSETITWEYYDKTKQYNTVGPITPLDFYLKYVKPYYNVDEKVGYMERKYRFTLGLQA